MAHLRQVSTTSQRRQMAFASSIWTSAGPVLPIGKNSSGSSPRHVARFRHVILDQASWIVVWKSARPSLPCQPDLKAGRRSLLSRVCNQHPERSRPMDRASKGSRLYTSDAADDLTRVDLGGRR